MFSKLNTAVCIGLEGRRVRVETDIRSGLPNMNIVGLASATVMEARERIKSAIINSGYEYPRGRITVNLTPADLRKNGSSLDLPIALGLLTSSMIVNPVKADEYGIMGELSLDGEVLGVAGILPMVIGLAETGIKKIIVPAANYQEASLISNVEIVPARHLTDCVEIINGRITPEDYISLNNIERKKLERIENPMGLDFSDIKGQENAKRAICIAVTGRHGLIMIGSPGCGKTMLAKRIPTIMPEMSEKELIQTAIIYSVAGKNNIEGAIRTDRPFRSPHNTIGKAGLLGGGNYPVPGEISLAHNGVLFLDEVCEFKRENIESLRTPIEEKCISHFRGGQQYVFPCNFQLVMSSNPCQCGYYGDPERLCKCSVGQLEQYRRKLSGPMMDRIDIRVSMEKVSYKQINNKEENGMSSEEMKNEINRGIEFARSQGRPDCNGNLQDADINKFCKLGADETELMKAAYVSLKLSPRSYKKILKVARTIADMYESETIRTEHLTEALSYRMLNEVNNS